MSRSIIYENTSLNYQRIPTFMGHVRKMNPNFDGHAGHKMYRLSSPEYILSLENFWHCLILSLTTNI